MKSFVISILCVGPCVNKSLESTLYYYILVVVVVSWNLDQLKKQAPLINDRTDDWFPLNRKQS